MDDDYQRDDDDFEESPRQKVGSQGAMSGPRNVEDGDDAGQGLDQDELDDAEAEQVIDVAQ